MGYEGAIPYIQCIIKLDGQIIQHVRGSVIVVIGSLLIINQIIFNECAISSFKDVLELFNASMHPFKTCAICK